MNPGDTFAAFARTLPRGAGRVHVHPGPVAEIVFASPGKKNALDAGMMLDFGAAAALLAAARVIILRGEGDSFCAGGDLGAVEAHLGAPGLGAGLGAFMTGAVNELRKLDAVLLAAVCGPAMGGGAELLAACDHVIAAPDARVGWVQARLGVSPGFGGARHLARRVGEARALRLLVEARVLTAEEARAAGLVDTIEADPVATARAWAAAAIALPEPALRGAVRVVRSAGAVDAAARETEVFAGLWGGTAHRAAVAARRRPG